MLGRDVFTPLCPERVAVDDGGAVEGDVYQLVEAFSKLLKRVPKEDVHDVAVDRISVNDCIYQITARLKKGTTINLDDLMPEVPLRYDVVITFIALLEMCRLHMIRVYQSSVCGPLYIQGIMEEVSEDDVVKLVENEITVDEKG
jgi:segregation and condensation protein A